MSPQQCEDYVQQLALMLGLTLDDARRARVAQHLARTAAMAAPLLALPLDPAQELCEIYCPAPFPASPDGEAR